MLYTRTIDEPLWKVLKKLSALSELQNFYLVGGTALALQFGHRKTEDLDFFTNGSFEKIKTSVEQYTKKLIQKSFDAKTYLEKTRKNLIGKKRQGKGKGKSL
ncbi:MAG: nucleotidyl transferase AbiEii/AbiGii toxin family protein [Ginsengibacter sp.]